LDNEVFSIKKGALAPFFIDEKTRYLFVDKSKNDK